MTATRFHGAKTMAMRLQIYGGDDRVAALAWDGPSRVVKTGEPVLLPPLLQPAALDDHHHHHLQLPLLIAVHVTQAEQVRLVRATWGTVAASRPVRLLFFGRAETPAATTAEAAALHGVELVGNASQTNAQRRTAMLRYALPLMEALGIPFLFKTDWHCALNVSALQQRLAHLDGHAQAHYLGTGSFLPPSTASAFPGPLKFAAGGAGYALSRPAVALVLQTIDRDASLAAVASEDQHLGLAAHRSGLRLQHLHGLGYVNPAFAAMMAGRAQTALHGFQDHVPAAAIVGLPRISYHYATASDMVLAAHPHRALPMQFNWNAPEFGGPAAATLALLRERLPEHSHTHDAAIVPTFEGRENTAGFLHVQLYTGLPDARSKAAAIGVGHTFLGLYLAGGIAAPAGWALHAPPQLWLRLRQSMQHTLVDCVVLALPDGDPAVQGPRMAPSPSLRPLHAEELRLPRPARATALGCFQHSHAAAVWLSMLVFSNYASEATHGWPSHLQWGFLVDVAQRAGAQVAFLGLVNTGEGHS
jgi:hypothetical protein